MQSMESADNVDICTGATAWTSPSNQTYILIFGQGLWFGSRMPDRSLINPNQCRAFGISLCDNPSDPYRQLGMYDPESDLNIPMHMSGSFCSLPTRCPTDTELATCPWIHLSDQDHWDPSSAFTRSASSTRRAPPTDPRPDISPIFLEHSFINRVVASAKVLKVKKPPDPKPWTPPQAFPGTTLSKHDSPFTGERHHTPTAESLAEKWQMGLQRAQQTMRVTTQAGIRSALHPLSRRYRTDLMSSRLRRLNCTFYTDTLFSTTKSINQNTCAQLYTNGKGFVHVHPLRSKSLVDESLDLLTDFVGITNTIFCDGSNEQTGPQSKFVRRLCHYKISL